MRFAAILWQAVENNLFLIKMLVIVTNPHTKQRIIEQDLSGKEQKYEYKYLSRINKLLFKDYRKEYTLFNNNKFKCYGKIIVKFFIINVLACHQQKYENYHIFINGWGQVYQNPQYQQTGKSKITQEYFFIEHFQNSLIINFLLDMVMYFFEKTYLVLVI
ncbi:unnamed protein product [Paramecium octaurelia]|uniref:Uncharacterized protein n=1 Tax=Paramecium octaurelia TaxID=43137 RepID=A0A8S1YLP6_PAROT|nr:unnamed protein product [Paramecium octaurelia]